MKTIFITSFHVLTPRNILWTPVFDILLKSRMKIVLLVPKRKEEYFKKYFLSEQVSVEGIVIGGKTRIFWDWFFGKIFQAMNETVAVRIRYGGTFRRRPFAHFFYYTLINFLGSFRFVRKILRMCDDRLAGGKRFETMLDRYSPNLIFSTDIIDKYDVELIRAARRRNIPVISLVRSWDNLTNFGILRVIPDWLLVWNTVSEREAIQYHDVPRERIVVCGVPHYDFYTHGKRMSREEFLNGIGGDPNKKIILYSPTGAPRLLHDDADKFILGILDKLDATIIVRFPPTNPVEMEEYIKPLNIVYDFPGVTFGKTSFGTDSILERDDDERFANELFHCDLVICGPTTVALDAVVFNKPTILINFNGHNTPFLDDQWENYQSEHLAKLLQSGSGRLVGSEKELLEWVKKYLDDPSCDSDGRARLVQSHCGVLDGKASERMAKFVLEKIS
ncbi:MAG: hypothetical protein G01um101433_719 [Parcubacteria group bacterium Gr01-1014_33]|nr:MAG: hypothetical protein G01um101433_719 [Parcubacteria group bacterium Gr01-1014_33]